MLHLCGVCVCVCVRPIVCDNYEVLSQYFSFSISSKSIWGQIKLIWAKTENKKTVSRFFFSWKFIFLYFLFFSPPLYILATNTKQKMISIHFIKFIFDFSLFFWFLFQIYLFLNTLAFQFCFWPFAYCVYFSLWTKLYRMTDSSIESTQQKQFCCIVSFILFSLFFVVVVLL